MRGAASRVLAVVVLSAAACRPESHGQRIEVRVPLGDVDGGSPALERSKAAVDVAPGSAPRVLRPHPSVRVQVPADEPRPRAMKAD